MPPLELGDSPNGKNLINDKLSWKMFLISLASCVIAPRIICSSLYCILDKIRIASLICDGRKFESHNFI